MRVIYNCKRCKIGKRMEYDAQGYRTNSAGRRVPASVWIQACGGGKPTVYGGDTEAGLCPQCGRCMKTTPVKGTFNPDKRCDGRCMSARNGACECSCGGKNHGANW